MQRTDRSLYYEVLVRSAIRPNHKLKGILEHAEGQSTQRIGVLAGYLAEEMCSRFKDKLDPHEVARFAMEAHRELLAENPHVRPGDELPRAADRLITTGLAQRR